MIGVIYLGPWATTVGVIVKRTYAIYKYLMSSVIRQIYLLNYEINTVI